MPCLGCSLLCLLGCNRNFFKARGFVASDGGRLGAWRSTPGSCTRVPFDGQPIGESQSIATFLWEDPSIHDPMRDQHRPHAPDAPLRLELARDGAGYSVVLTTVKILGTRFTSADCTSINVQTQEQAPVVAGRRTSLAGHLAMDCMAGESRVTADLHFERCEF